MQDLMMFNQFICLLIEHHVRMYQPQQCKIKFHINAKKIMISWSTYYMTLCWVFLTTVVSFYWGENLHTEKNAA